MPLSSIRSDPPPWGGARVEKEGTVGVARLALHQQSLTQLERVNTFRFQFHIYTCRLFKDWMFAVVCAK